MGEELQLPQERPVLSTGGWGKVQPARTSNCAPPTCALLCGGGGGKTRRGGDLWKSWLARLAYRLDSKTADQHILAPFPGRSLQFARDKMSACLLVLLCECRAAAHQRACTAHQY